jgi:hypothetical protein
MTAAAANEGSGPNSPLMRVAPGLIDAVMYLMVRFGEHGRGLLALCAVREASAPTQAHRVTADGRDILDFEATSVRLDRRAATIVLYC